MKYNININQLALSELSKDMDIVDAAILDYLIIICRTLSNKVEIKRIKENGHIWTWVDLSSFLKDMPLLRLKSRAALSTRIKKIEKDGFISTYSKRIGSRKRLYVKLNAKVDSLYVKLNASVRETERKSGFSVRETEPIIILETYNGTSDPGKSTISKKPQPITPIISADQYHCLIDGFKPVNPFFLEFYKNKTERKALEDIVKQLGYEEVLVQISSLAKLCALPYAPRITKPTELKRDMGKLVLFERQAKGGPALANKDPDADEKKYISVNNK